MLGIIGLGLVVGALVLSGVLAWMVSKGYGDAMIEAVRNGSTPDNFADSPELERYTSRIVGQVGLISLGCFMGFVGWVVSIIATAINRGRTYGIWGIVVGVLAPILLFAIFIAGMAPAIGSIAR